MNQDYEKNKRSEESGNSPSLEELLKLKRHEVPEADSWEDFQIEFRRRAMESVVSHSVRLGRWQRAFLYWIAPAFGLGALTAAFLFFVGPSPIFDVEPSASGSVASIQTETSGYEKVSAQVAESRGGEFVDGAIAFSVEEESEGVETGFLGKSLRYSSENAVFEESALTILSSQAEEPVAPVTF